MADNENNENVELQGEIATAVGIARLWQRIKDTFVRKDGNKVLSDNNFSNEDKAKLDNLQPYNLPIASSSTLGGIKIGAGLSVDQNGRVSVTSAGEVIWDEVIGTPTTLAGYGITDAATSAQLEEVRTAVSKAYHFRGSVNTYSDLASIQNPSEGDVYNVKDTGKNYAWAVENSQGFWDDIGGTFDISPLTVEDINIITGYATSEAAFDQILEEGGLVELGNNLVITTQKIITTDTTIDLNGYGITSTIAKSAQKELFIVDGAKLTFKGEGSITYAYRIARAINGGEVDIEDGTYNIGDVGITAEGENSCITINGGSLSAAIGGIGVSDGASAEINGGTISCSDGLPLFTNKAANEGGCSIILNNGTLIGNIDTAYYEACGVYIANNDTFVMNGGEVRGVNGCGILMRAGNVTINGGLVTATGEAGTTGYVDDNVTAMSKSTVIYHETANYPGKQGMSLTITGGRFVGVDHSVEILSTEVSPNVTITGGEFTPVLE